MPVAKELLELLVCPVCRTPVKSISEGQALKCEACRRVYPVREDIPVMLVDEAKIDAE